MSEKFFDENSKLISRILSLRPPQQESLEIFARLVNLLSLEKNPNLTDELSKVRELCPTLTSFEREFPSFCFSLATGIGKTRLMGACIAYLHYAKDIKNFFVMAPNLTIYDKLKSDLGSPENPKYVFRGLDKFSTPPRIIDGDNYNNFRSSSFIGANEIIINVFNISKLNSDSKGDNNAPARIKRLNEILGESYFGYLQSLPDLCIFMDESHHYHADKSFEVINELQPIIGVELTATPQIQKGSRKILFENVVYEYSLASALKDEKYVKVPVVFTRKDFRPEEFTPEQLDREKLIDGIKLHEETKNRLEIYSRETEKPLVRPFILVVAKDTAHSRKLLDYIKSKEFFGGRYAEKVIEVNSSLRGAEKDSNIERLLSLESPDNEIEIVIHVNMLKEGWDVTNLYTIIPLRASASETLTEQTIGRGLRLPYGERTGIEEIDRLSIVSHDRYEAIVNLANDPDSLVRKIRYIEPTDSTDTDDKEKEVVELPTTYDFLTNSESFQKRLALDIQKENEKSSVTPRPQEQNLEIAKFVAAKAATSVVELNRTVKSFDAIKESEIQEVLVTSVVNDTINKFSEINLTRDELKNTVQKAIETCVQHLTENIIPIPRAVIQASPEIKQGFYDFHLELGGIYWHASGDELIGTELKENGKTVTYNSDIASRVKVDTTENEIIRHIIIKDNVDYFACSDLLYSLVNDAKEFFKGYLSEEAADKVMRDRQSTLAEEIYRQMNKHFYREEISFTASEMRPFSRIEPCFGGKIKTDEIYDLRANIQPSEVPRKIFQGFNKACHTLYKFDSNTERIFAVVLEQDNDVLKWLRPSVKQFDIYYTLDGNARYEPDFIVETDNKIYMVETKMKKDLHDIDVQSKAIAGQTYCESATKWNLEHGGKAWEYVLLSHDEIRLNSSFNHLINCREKVEQTVLINGRW